MTPARVFLVVWWFDRFGGMERHVTDMAIALARRGMGVTVFSEMPLPQSNRYAQELDAAGVELVAPRRQARVLARLETSRLYRVAAGLDSEPSVGWAGMEDEYLRHQHLPGSARALLSALERHARRAAPDVVHVHGCRLAQHRVLQWASARGYPTAYTEHVTISDWGGPFDPEAPWIVGDLGDVLSCVSDHSRASLLACLPASREVHVARHIIRDPGLDDPAAGAPRSARSKPVSILAVGRLSHHKGYDILLQAAALLRERGVAFRIRIAGGGDELNELEALRERLGLADAVTFLGQKTPAEVAALWKDTDIGVAPSRTEAMPLSIVEAMAQARPIVASRVGGVPELLRDGENGLLVTAGDAVGLADALCRVIADPVLAASLAAGARKSFETGGWSERAVTDQALAIYVQAARSRAARTSLVSGADWAETRAREAAASTRRVCVFAWKLSAFGDMEYLLAQQAIALARAGVQVSVVTARPAGPFNGYVRSMRRAGVRVTFRPAWGLAWAFAELCAKAAPGAVHLHGWRRRCAWLAPVLRLAAERGVPAAYTEHADDAAAAPGAKDVAALAMFGALSAVSPGIATALAQETGRPVSVVPNAGTTRPAVCERQAVALSPAQDGFALDLAEAMASLTPVVVCDPTEALPIRHRANGLIAVGDPAEALAELASDPLLARQFAVAARRTYELEGLRDLAIVGELVALYGAAASAGQDPRAHG